LREEELGVGQEIEEEDASEAKAGKGRDRDEEEDEDEDEDDEEGGDGGVTRCVCGDDSKLSRLAHEKNEGETNSVPLREQTRRCRVA